MRHWIVGSVVFLGLAGAIAFSNYGKGPARTAFPLEERNPVSHLRWADAAEEFQFAMVSDRTGGHRANVFSQAALKLNLLQPAFVVSVGDLIEGGQKSPAQYKKQWTEFDTFVANLSMPFFYVAGNHDAGAKESAKVWEEKLGPRHYHFVYGNNLFLLLNSEDPPGGPGSIGADQLAWAKRTLEANNGVRWTMVVVHRPLWVTNNGAGNGWKAVEELLADRPYTVFAGHLHRFQKYVRNGRNYYQLATTGGASAVRGVDQGEFDHITWITMKKDGPLLSHITLDAIHTEDLKPFTTNESGSAKAKAPLHPVEGFAHFQGTPMPGAVVTLVPEKKGARAVGIVQADGSFELTTYQGYDGAAEGEYAVTVTWRQRQRDGKFGPNLLPERYDKVEQSGLKARIEPQKNKLVFELRK